MVKYWNSWRQWVPRRPPNFTLLGVTAKKNFAALTRRLCPPNLGSSLRQWMDMQDVAYTRQVATIISLRYSAKCTGFVCRSAYLSSLPSWYTCSAYLDRSTWPTPFSRSPGFPVGRQRLRSSSTSALDVPSTRLSTVGDRAFPVAAARSWNSLCQTPPKRRTDGRTDGRSNTSLRLSVRPSVRSSLLYVVSVRGVQPMWRTNRDAS